jgi:hypothetical protein
MVNERMTWGSPSGDRCAGNTARVPVSGTDARCKIFLAFGQEEDGETAVFASRRGTGKWQTTICLPIKRSGRLPNPTAPWATGVAVRNLCVGLRGEGSPSA